MRSIHLQTLPSLNQLPSSPDVSENMDRVRSICNVALFLRKENRVRVRVPLQTLVIYSKSEPTGLRNFVDIIKSEINVKEVVFSPDFEKVASEKLVINLKKCGQIMSKHIPELMKAASSNNWSRERDGILVAGRLLAEGYYDIKLETKQKNTKACANGEIIVLLDPTLTPELENEGIARDIVRMVQQTRKNIGLSISDRIYTSIYSTNQRMQQVLETDHLKEYIAKETLSHQISTSPAIQGNPHEHEHEEFGKVQIYISAHKQ